MSARLGWLWLGVVLLLPIGYAAVWLYSHQYENYTPTVPLPQGAELLVQSSRQSAIVRYWYYAKYASAQPYETVATFYQQRNSGSWRAKVFPPASPEAVATLPDASFTSRDQTDPPEKTIIVAEVGWEPLDQTLFFPVVCLCGPTMWLVLLSGLAIRTFRLYRSGPLRRQMRDTLPIVWC